LYITRFYNQINFFITLINGGDFGWGDLINVGAILQWGDLTCIRMDMGTYRLSTKVTIHVNMYG
jgi:hypothetical protein